MSMSIVNPNKNSVPAFIDFSALRNITKPESLIAARFRFQRRTQSEAKKRPVAEKPIQLVLNNNGSSAPVYGEHLRLHQRGLRSLCFMGRVTLLHIGNGGCGSPPCHSRCLFVRLLA